MVKPVLLMTGGHVALIIILLALAVVIGVVAVHEKKRKEQSRRRAAERKRKREEALQKMREEEAAMEGKTSWAAEAPQSDSDKNTRVRASDLEALASVRENDKDTNTYQTGPLHFSTGTIGTVSDGKISGKGSGRHQSYQELREAQQRQEAEEQARLKAASEQAGPKAVFQQAGPKASSGKASEKEEGSGSLAAEEAASSDLSETKAEEPQPVSHKETQKSSASAKVNFRQLASNLEVDEKPTPKAPAEEPVPEETIHAQELSFEIQDPDITKDAEEILSHSAGKEKSSPHAAAAQAASPRYTEPAVQTYRPPHVEAPREVTPEKDQRPKEESTRAAAASAEKEVPKAPEKTSASGKVPTGQTEPEDLAYNENDPETIRLRKMELRRAEHERRVREKEKYAAELADLDEQARRHKTTKHKAVRATDEDNEQEVPSGKAQAASRSADDDEDQDYGEEYKSEYSYDMYDDEEERQRRKDHRMRVVLWVIAVILLLFIVCAILYLFFGTGTSLGSLFAAGGERFPAFPGQGKGLCPYLFI